MAFWIRAVDWGFRNLGICPLQVVLVAMSFLVCFCLLNGFYGFMPWILGV